MSDAIRVRFAPSPTGYLHVGGLRTALFNYLFAKKQGGIFILRIEDTDQKRFVPGAIEKLIKTLHEMGIYYEEGEYLDGETLTTKGAVGPYTQSERLPLYREYIEKLLENGRAYHCFCTQERLDTLRAEQAQNKQAPRYDKHCLALSDEEKSQKLSEQVPYVIRLNVSPEHGAIIFQDLVRGKVSIHARDIDDQVLMKSDGFPTYHLANVVDDHLMNITHVIRGEEWLPSTPKHVLLYEAFGWQAPIYAHLPLLLNADKSKLSKRQGDVAVEDYLKKGYLKETIVNFIALLGWNPGKGSTQEIFSLDELVQAFDFAQIHKGGAVFDLKKLDWMNAEYIKKLSVDELYDRVVAGSFLAKDLIRNAPAAMQSEAYLKRVLTVERERLAKLSDIGEHNLFFFAIEPVYDIQKLNWKENSADMTKEALERAYQLLSDLNAADWLNQETVEKILLEAAGEKKGDFLWPLRFALTGADRSPSPAQVAWVLGKEESLVRLESALKKLS